MTKVTGNILDHVPTNVLAVTKDPDTDEIIYLCGWKQDLIENGQEKTYIEPSWVQSY